MSERQIPAYLAEIADRTAHLRTDAGWLEGALRDPRSRFMEFAGDKVLLRKLAEYKAEIVWKNHVGLGLPFSETEPVLLGVADDGAACFAAQLADAGYQPDEPEFRLCDVRTLAVKGLLSETDTGMIAQARSLLYWHSRHRFCSNCGELTIQKDAGYRRECRACGAHHFPRTDPVAIVAVVRDDKTLLGRSPRFEETVYSTLAGFVEPGETVEEATRREVFEETGVKVGAVRYLMSQPWPFPANLMLGMIAEAESEQIVIDRTELADARWFSFEEVHHMFSGTHPEALRVPPPISIAHHLLAKVLKDAG